jgi:hypothetical protein
MNNAHILCNVETGILSLKDLLAAVRESEEFLKGTSDEMAGKDPIKVIQQFLSTGELEAASKS